MLDDLKAIDFEGSFETLDKGASSAVVDISGAEWDRCAALHGRRHPH